MCLPMTAAAAPAYCVVKCNRLLHGASSTLSECPAACFSLSPTLFPPSLFHLLLCRRATFFTFLAAFTKQAGNISVINIGLAALPSSSGAISYRGSAWVSLFLSSPRSCSQFAFVSLSRGSGINVIVVCACKTPADCRRLPTYNTNTNRRHTCTHTHALIYSHSHTNRITGALSQAPTHALFASAHSLALSLSLSSLSPFGFLGVAFRWALLAAAAACCCRQSLTLFASKRSCCPPACRKGKLKEKPRKKRRSKIAE